MYLPRIITILTSVLSFVQIILAGSQTHSSTYTRPLKPRASIVEGPDPNQFHPTSLQNTNETHISPEDQLIARVRIDFAHANTAIRDIIEASARADSIYSKLNDRRQELEASRWSHEPAERAANFHLLERVNRVEAEHTKIDSDARYVLDLGCHAEEEMQNAQAAVQEGDLREMEAAAEELRLIAAATEDAATEVEEAIARLLVAAEEEVKGSEEAWAAKDDEARMAMAFQGFTETGGTEEGEGDAGG